MNKSQDMPNFPMVLRTIRRRRLLRIQRVEVDDWNKRAVTNTNDQNKQQNKTRVVDLSTKQNSNAAHLPSLQMASYQFEKKRGPKQSKFGF